MRIGVPRETRPGETRVAATPKTVEAIRALGYAVFVERGAGALSSFDDAAYARAGADVVDEEVWHADVLLKINAPTEAEIALLRPGQVLVSLLAPALNPDLVQTLAARGVTALAMDAVPRISRAQSLDVLSSMANIGGYRAVVEAAHEFGSLLHRSGHRRGQGAAGQGARRGRRRRRARRDRHGILAGCRGAGLRRPPGGRRAGRVDGRGVPAHRHRAGGPLGRRLRQGDQRRLRRQGRADVRRAGRRRRHPHHHRADPGASGAAADHRVDGGFDEARLGGRRHGGLERRQRRRLGGRPEGGHRQRRHDPGLHRPAGSAAHAGLAAVRHEPGQPAQAGHPGQGRASSPSTSTTRCSAA